MTKNLDSLRNEWTFGGELFYMKEQFGEFGASLKIRGISQRMNSESTQICEFSCLVPYDVYEDFVNRGVKVYDKILVSGHLETWQKSKVNGNGELKVDVKQMFIVDYLLEVTKK